MRQPNANEPRSLASQTPQFRPCADSDQITVRYSGQTVVQNSPLNRTALDVVPASIQVAVNNAQHISSYATRAIALDTLQKFASHVN